MLYAIIFNHYYPLFYVPQYTVCGGCMRVCAHTAYRIQQFSKTDRIQHTRIHDFLKRAIILYPASDLQSKGYLPGGLFEKFIGNVFDWSQQTTDKSHEFKISKRR